jgi:hypothetical protein
MINVTRKSLLDETLLHNPRNRHEQTWRNRNKTIIPENLELETLSARVPAPCVVIVEYPNRMKITTMTSIKNITK